MDVLIHLFVGLHIIGIAALLGGFLTQMKAMGQGTARFVPGMLHGALTMLVTGVALVGLNQAQGAQINTIKIGIKLALLIVILGLFIMPMVIPGWDPMGVFFRNVVAPAFDFVLWLAGHGNGA